MFLLFVSCSLVNGFTTVLVPCISFSIAFSLFLPRQGFDRHTNPCVKNKICTSFHEHIAPKNQGPAKIGTRMCMQALQP